MEKRKLKFKKLPAKYAVWIVPFLLSALMSGIISFINLSMNLGFIPEFVSKWFATWMLSWAIAYPTVLVCLPLVRRLTALFVDLPPQP
ncbi:DUF2798 domain-containing protein [Acinetobacter haemolyticus]|nr:DUF2798 domain-containing protein [Acinetobacter haemolyticus]WHR59405.1 DUF2798 domain-containing protein [Acinetobacter haemolyticus]